ncbi:MAG: hypothetical protein NDI62_02255 [Burkholderiales bacterium]|nr:hypothetical protein [Burkholderiales bacterium]
MENYVFIIPILILILGAFILQGLIKISASPPCVGLGTRFGKRNQKIYEEGWNFFPLYPYLKGFILIKMERINIEVSCDKVRTLDKAESKISIGLTIRPVKELLIPYIDSGQEKKVTEILIKIIEEKIREWCMNKGEGPNNWEELNMSKLEGVSVLIKKIAGNKSEYLTQITGIAQKVPTWIWLRYFSNPQPREENLLENEKYWAENEWNNVNTVLNEIRMKEGEEGINLLITQVAKRREDLEKIRSGQGKLIIKDLGIIIERLNIGEINVLGEVGKKAENEAKEKQEKAAEILELEHISKRILALMKDPPDGPGLTREQALEQIQLSQGKTTKTIDAKSINLDPTTSALIGKILNKII